TAAVPYFPHPLKAPPRPAAARALRAVPLAVGDPAPTRCGSRAPLLRNSSAALPEIGATHHIRRPYSPPPSWPVPLPQRRVAASAAPTLLSWQTPPHRGCLPRGSALDLPSIPRADRAHDR